MGIHFDTFNLSFHKMFSYSCGQIVVWKFMYTKAYRVHRIYQRKIFKFQMILYCLLWITSCQGNSPLKLKVKDFYFLPSGKFVSTFSCYQILAVIFLFCFCLFAFFFHIWFWSWVWFLFAVLLNSLALVVEDNLYCFVVRKILWQPVTVKSRIQMASSPLIHQELLRPSSATAHTCTPWQESRSCLEVMCV